MAGRERRGLSFEVNHKKGNKEGFLGEKLNSKDKKEEKWSTTFFSTIEASKIQFPIKSFSERIWLILRMCIVEILRKLTLTSSHRSQSILYFKAHSSFSCLRILSSSKERDFSDLIEKVWVKSNGFLTTKDMSKEFSFFMKNITEFILIPSQNIGRNIRDFPIIIKILITPAFWDNFREARMGKPNSFKMQYFCITLKVSRKGFNKMGAWSECTWGKW